MSRRVYVEVSSTTSGRVLSLRNEIQNIQPSIGWYYDDATQTLEMHGWQKWPFVEEETSKFQNEYSDIHFDINWE